MKTRSRTRVFVRIVPMHFWGGRGASAFFVLITCVLLFFSISSPANLSAARAGTADLLAPVLGVVSKPVHDLVAFTGQVTGLAELRSENAALTAENAKLRDWYQTALSLQAQNKSLQDLLHLKTEPHHRYVTSRVVADSSNAYVKSLLVAAGQKDGVQKDQAVLGRDGLIGRVVEAGQNAARVLLLGDMNSRVPVLIEGLQQRAILAGTNEDLPILKHLVAGSEIKNGMRVVTSGHGGVFPPSLPVGEVLVGQDGQVFVTPYADTDRVIYVKIVDAPTDPNLRRGRVISD